MQLNRDNTRDAQIEWHAAAPEQVLARLESGTEGLTEAEAQARLERFGRNALPQAKRRSAWTRLAAQFNNVLILVLLAAAVITFAIGHMTDAAVIAGVVIINAIIGYVQEGKAERALDAVRAMLAAHAIVSRGGERRSVPADELVPGDVVWLASGDRVPADLRLLRGKNLRTNEAALTGESAPVDKRVDARPADTVLAERTSMAYAGTVVTYGTGCGLVCDTGPHTELGRIGTLVAGVDTLATPLTRKLDQLARRLTVFVLAAAVVTLAFGVLVHSFDMAEMFLAVVGLAVAAIPEGLPAIVTITLAIGTQRMARRHAIVRRLPAVEALGSVTLIFTDKTGTLTKNEMTAVRVVLPGRVLDVSGAGYAPVGGFTHRDQPVAPDGATDLIAFARAALLCNDAQLNPLDGAYAEATAERWRLVGDPTEGALITLAMKAGLAPAEEAAEFRRVDDIAFESEQQWMATLHRDRAHRAFVVLKGAPERVLALCARQGDQDGEAAPLDRSYWTAQIEGAARNGQRVLAVASRTMPDGRHELARDDITPQFTLLGLVGLIDPPREEAVAALAACRAAGVRVVMITGDHAATAAAIARRLGMQDAAPLSGQEIETLDDAALAERLRATDVIARASPQHKLRLVQLAQAGGQVVAMTGDGANDAPALKRADVGVAMGANGTDAAREAADLVLTDDNFASIANAVREGRTITDNIKKALVFILPTNGGEAGVILLAVFLGHALPITALQILWINMVTTVTQDIALAFEPSERDVMARPPRPPREPLMTRILLMRVGYVTLLLAAMTFGVFHFELARGMSLEVARTSAVNVLAIGEMVYLFNCRHFVAPAWRNGGLTSNRVALAVSLVLIVLQAAITYAPPMQALFGTAALDATSWAVVIAVSLAKFGIVEAEKAVLRRIGIMRL